jgi:hypothetical protein
MLVIRLELRVLAGSLPVGGYGVEADCEEGGVQEARRSHGNSPLAGGQRRHLSGPTAVINTMVTR